MHPRTLVPLTGPPERDPASWTAARGRFAVPVITTFRRLHLFPATHPCYAGDLGVGPNPKVIARIKSDAQKLLV